MPSALSRLAGAERRVVEVPGPEEEDPRARRAQPLAKLPRERGRGQSSPITTC